ncbi:MAG: hypothetical protein WAK54_32915 [Bradyrhizobium sp.]
MKTIQPGSRFNLTSQPYLLLENDHIVLAVGQIFPTSRRSTASSSGSRKQKLGVAADVLPVE